MHPLLHQALARCKDTLPSALYRSLEVTASEALELAAMTGNTGPQGTTFTVVASMMHNTAPDRQVRRKADNLCRSLTELCISLCETYSSLPSSPAIVKGVSSAQRSPIRLNGDNALYTPTYSSHIRSSVEPDGEALRRNSPSRALSRIEARRSSLLGTRSRDTSQEPPDTPSTPSISQMTTRLRSGTSLLRPHRSSQAHEDTNGSAVDEEDDPTLRAPSRAVTEFAHLRRNVSTSARTNRLSGDFSHFTPPEYSYLHSSSPAPVSYSGGDGVRRSQTLKEHNTQNQHYTPASGSLLRDGTRRYVDHGIPPPLPVIDKGRGDVGIALSSEDRRRSTQPSSQYTSSVRRDAGNTTVLGRSGSLKRGAGRSNASSSVD
jgi:hypothetical protein